MSSAMCEAGCGNVGKDRGYGVACDDCHESFERWEAENEAGRYAAKNPDTQAATDVARGERSDIGGFLSGYLDGLS